MSVKKTGVEFETIGLDKFLSGMKSAAQATQDYIDAGKKFNQSAGNIAAGIEKISSAASGLTSIATASQGLDALGKSLQALKDIGPIGTNVRSITTGLTNLAQAMSTIDSTGVANLQKIGNALQALQGASGNLNQLKGLNLGNLLGGGSGGGSGGILGGLLGGLGSIKSVLGSVAGIFKTGVFGAIGNIGSTLGSGLLTGLTGLANAAGGVVNRIVQKLTFGLVGNFTGLLGPLASGIGNVVGFLGKGITGAVGLIGSAISGLVSGVGTAIRGIGSFLGTVASTVASIASGIYTAVTSVFSGLGNIIGSIAGPLGSTFGNIFSVAVGNVIGNGITSAISAVISTAGSLIQAGLGQIDATVKVGIDFQDSLAEIQADLTNLNPKLATDSGVFDPATAAKLASTINRIALDPKLVVGFKDATDSAKTLTRYGYSLDQVANGGLEAAVLLQNSVGGSFSLAAETLAKYASINNVAPEGLTKAVSEITATITQGGFRDLNDYRYALVNSAGAMQSFGVSAEDANTILAVSNKLFASGRTGGTGLRTLFEHLVPTTDKAKDAMKALNLSFFDSKGTFVGMEETIRRLRKAFSGLSEVQAEEYTQAIFGATAGREVRTLLNQVTDQELAQAKATILAADANKSAAVRTATLGAKLANLGDQFQALRGKIFGKELQDVFVGPVEALQNLATNAGPAFENFGKRLAIALTPAAATVTTLIDQLGKTGAASGKINLGGLGISGGLDLNKMAAGLSFDLGKVNVTGALDLSKGLAAGSISFGSLFSLGGGIDLSKHLASTTLSFGDYFHFTGVLNLKDYIGTVLLDVPSVFTLGGSLDLKDKVAAVALDVPSYFSLSGSLDLKSYIGHVDLSIADYFGLSGTLDLSQHLAGLTISLGDTKFGGTLSGQGLTVDLAGLHFAITPDQVSKAQADIDATLAPITSYLIGIPARLTSALSVFNTGKKPDQIGTQQGPASFLPKDFGEQPAGLQGFLAKLQNIPSAITVAFTGLTIPDIGALIVAKIKEKLPANFSLTDISLPDIGKAIADAVKAKIPANIDLGDTLSNITTNLNSFAASVGLADLVITTAGGDQGALGQLRKFVTDTLKSISDAISGVDQSKAQAIGSSLSTVTTSILGVFTTLSNLGNANIGVAVTGLSNLTTGLLNFATGVTTGLDGKAIGTSAVNFVKSFIDEFTIALSPENLKAVDIADAAGGFVLAISSQFKAALAPGNLTGIGTSLGELGSNIVTQLGNVLNDKKFAGQLGESLSNILVGITQGLADVLNGVNAADSAKNANIQGALQTFVNNFLAGLADGLAKADYGNVFSSFIHGLLGSLSGFKELSDALEADSKIPSGFSVEGVKSRMRIINAVMNLGREGFNGDPAGGTTPIKPSNPFGFGLPKKLPGDTAPATPGNSPIVKQIQLPQINSSDKSIVGTANDFSTQMDILRSVASPTGTIQTQNVVVQAQTVTQPEVKGGLPNEQNAFLVTNAGKSAPPPVYDKFGLNNTSAHIGQVLADKSAQLGDTLTGASTVLAQSVVVQAQTVTQATPSSDKIQVPPPNTSDASIVPVGSDFTTQLDALQAAATTAGAALNQGATAASTSLTTAGSTVDTAAQGAAGKLNTLIVPADPLAPLAGAAAGVAAKLSGFNVPLVPPFPGWGTIIGPVNVPAQPAPAGGATFFKGFASGTNYVPATGSYVVGEKGPELVTLQKGQGVVPTDPTQKILANIRNSVKDTVTAAPINVAVPVQQTLGAPTTQPGFGPFQNQGNAFIAPNLLTGTPAGGAPPLSIGSPLTGPEADQRAQAQVKAQNDTTTAIQRTTKNVGDLNENIANIVNSGKALNLTIQDIQSGLKSIPGLFGSSAVTPEDMAAAANGTYKDKPDEFVRQLESAANNPKDKNRFPDIFGRANKAITNIGETPMADPKALADQVKSLWASGQLFSNPQNIKDLVNVDAVKQSLIQQQEQKQGQTNLNNYLSNLLGGGNLPLYSGTPTLPNVAGLPGATAAGGLPGATAGLPTTQTATTQQAVNSSKANGGLTPDQATNAAGVPPFPGWTGKDGLIPPFPQWVAKDSAVIPVFPGWAKPSGFIPDLVWKDFVPVQGSEAPAPPPEQPVVLPKAIGSNALPKTGTYLAGEKGGELIQARAGTRIFPAKTTGKIMSLADSLARQLPSIHTDPRGFYGGQVNRPQTSVVTRPTINVHVQSPNNHYNLAVNTQQPVSNLVQQFRNMQVQAG